MTIALTVLVAIIIAVALFCFGLAIFIFCRINNKRYNGNKYVKYFTADDFHDLTVEVIHFLSDHGQVLRGFIYRKNTNKEPKALLLFAHGFGAGHLAYTTEINTLADAGYWIMAYDATGCGESDGKYMGGFDQGVIDLKHAIRYIREDVRFRNVKKILVGHSWGAFCVLNAISEDGIDGVIAMCGFISGAKVLAQNTVGRRFPYLSFLVEWFLRLFNCLRYGSAANCNSLKSVKKANKPVYLIYGSEDQTVCYKKNGAILVDAVKDLANVRCKVCEGRGHNPYLTPEAEREMNKTFSAIAKQKKKDRSLAIAMYRDIDYSTITEEDAEVMDSIIEFCDQIVKSGTVSKELHKN